MTQAPAQATTPAATYRVVGIVADGAVKVLLGAAFLIGATRLGDLLGVPTWLMITSGLVLLAAGGVEMRYVRRRRLRTYTLLMIAYDSGWTLTALTGLLVAWRGGGAGGEVWMGYQAVAPLVFAALLLASAPVPEASGARADGPAH
ncbi:hypothetical protein ACF09I_24360 [Streptomyces sp. NPDC014940]|uniref:hypothetical protein n=1 Tax=Streptomyces sp. NPDC014940 TaxID=3364932 RepID=UPI0037034B33